MSIDRRRNGADPAGDQAIMFDTAMLREVENSLFAEGGRIKVARVNQKLVIFGLGFRDDLAIGIDDEAAAEQREAILDASLGDGNDPGRILIGSRLHRQ